MPNQLPAHYTQKKRPKLTPLVEVTKEHDLGDHVPIEEWTKRRNEQVQNENG